MDGTILRETLQAILPKEVIYEAAREMGVVLRERKLDVEKLVCSLVLSAGNDDSGVLADAMRRYKGETGDDIVRGAFYAWLDDELAALMQRLLAGAMSYAASLPAHLPGVLGGVDDWVAFDSETVTLRPALSEVFPASGTAAGVKVHKELSIGRGCMTDCHFSPAREHDSPHLVVDERFRGKGLLADLGYVSIERLHRCDGNDTKYVVRFVLAYAIRACHWHLLVSHLDAATSDEEWEWLAMRIADDARDPNWRSRPSVLDRLLGLTAPRGRPRKKKLRDCRPSMVPYRRNESVLEIHRAAN
jgi:hypothetical protein